MGTIGIFGAVTAKMIAETTLRTPDIGGKTRTSEMGKAIADAL